MRVDRRGGVVSESRLSRAVSGDPRVWTIVRGEPTEAWRIAATEDGFGYECRVRRPDGEWSEVKIIRRAEIFYSRAKAIAGDRSI